MKGYGSRGMRKEGHYKIDGGREKRVGKVDYERWEVGGGEGREIRDATEIHCFV